MAKYKRFTGKVSEVVKKDGTLYMRAVYELDGERRQVWRKVVDKKSDAKAAVIEEIEKRLNEEKKEEKEKTFADLAEYYKTEHAIPAVFINDVKIKGKKNSRVILHNVKQLEEHFRKTKLSQITRGEVIKFRNKRLETPVRKLDAEGKETFEQRAFGSVNHELKTLRAMLNIAHGEGWLAKLPSFKDLMSAAIENKREIIPNEDEFARILKAINDRPRIHHILPIVLLIADCGARPIEVFNLEWKDVDLDKKLVYLTSDKGRRRTKRPVGLTKRLIAQLEKIEKTGERVFNQKGIARAWESVQADANVKHLTPYHLRHLYASRINQLMNISELTKMKLMGQTQIKTFDRYVKLPDELVLGVAEDLDANPYLPVQESDTLQ